MVGGKLSRKVFLLVLDFFHKFSQKLLKNSFVIRQPEQIQYPETNLSSENSELLVVLISKTNLSSETGKLLLVTVYEYLV